MIGSDLEGVDPESRAAGWAASAIGDVAAAMRAVIEAYGNWLAAADLGGVVSRYSGNATVMQPEFETVVGSRQPTAHTTPLSRTCAWTLRSDVDDITVNGDLAAARAASQGTITIRSTGESQPARLGPLFVPERTGATGRSRGTCTSRCRSSQEGAAPASRESLPGFGHVPHPLAVAEHDGLRRLGRRLPARTGAVQADVGLAGAVRVPALGVAALLAVTALAHRCTEGNVKAGPLASPVALMSAAAPERMVTPASAP